MKYETFPVVRDVIESERDRIILSIYRNAESLDEAKLLDAACANLADNIIAALNPANPVDFMALATEGPSPNAPHTEPEKTQPADGGVGVGNKQRDESEDYAGPAPPPPILPPRPVQSAKNEPAAGMATKSAADELRKRMESVIEDGCSIETLADKAKLSAPGVRNILAGANPRAATYDKLADALDLLGA